MVNLTGGYPLWEENCVYGLKTRAFRQWYPGVIQGCNPTEIKDIILELVQGMGILRVREMQLFITDLQTIQISNTTFSVGLPAFTI